MEDQVSIRLLSISGRKPRQWTLQLCHVPHVLLFLLSLSAESHSQRCPSYKTTIKRRWAKTFTLRKWEKTFTPPSIPQWGAADAEIKVPSGENTELKRSPFQAWSRSVYSHTCYVYCQGFLPCLFLPFQSIHLHFFQNLSQFFPVLACRIKMGYPAECRFPCWVPAAYT